jgi:hypothetical protein
MSALRPLYHRNTPKTNASEPARRNVTEGQRGSLIPILFFARLNPFRIIKSPNEKGSGRDFITETFVLTHYI